MNVCAVPKINVLVLDAKSLGLSVLTAPLRHIVHTSANAHLFVCPNFCCLPITDCFNAATMKSQYCFLLRTSIFPTWKPWRTLLQLKTPVDLNSSGLGVSREL